MFELLNPLLFLSIIAVEIIVVILLVAIVTYYFRRKSKRIKKIQADLDLFREDILNAEKEFKIEYDKDLYFSKKTLHLWKEKWKHVESAVKRFSKMQRDWRIQVVRGADLQDSILYVHQVFENGVNLVKERNNAFIERECEKYKSLFDTLEEYPLTQNQRRSIITDECNNLVVAGAGTGKTSTIVGKAKYIIEKGLAKPDEILLLAFARGVRKELDERISRMEVQPTVKTFHALGLNIIAESEGIKPSVSELSSDRENLKLIQFIQGTIGLDKQQILDEFVDERPALGQDNAFLKKLTNYFVFYLRPYRSIFKFSSWGEYIDCIRENQIRSLKGDSVRSYEECEIANFLYINGINCMHAYEVGT